MNIAILGTSGQAKETADLIKENINGKIVGFVDKNFSSGKIFDYKLLGTDQQINSIIKRYKVTHFFVAIGDIKTRSKIYLTMKKILKPLTIVSKKANISKYARFGEHVIIYPGVTINAEVVVGDNVYINSNAAIAHEVKIGNHVNVNPGVNIAGKVIIDDYCFIGIGASIRENLRIAKNTIIGGGAMVTKDTKPGKTYIGVPAKIMTTRE